jgi:alpha-D-xyloside xylohydrolase
MEDEPDRSVYLPPGLWTDYQTGETYQGAGWYHIRAGGIPAVMLVSDGAAIPHIRLVQSTRWMDWSEIDLAVYGTSTVEGLFCLPEGGVLHTLRLEREGDGFALRDDPLEDRVRWNVRARSPGDGVLERVEDYPGKIRGRIYKLRPQRQLALLTR